MARLNVYNKTVNSHLQTLKVAQGNFHYKWQLFGEFSHLHKIKYLPSEEMTLRFLCQGSLADVLENFIKLTRCVATSLLYTMTSSKYTRQIYYYNPVRTFSKSHSNVAREPHGLKGIALNCSSSPSVTNVGFYLTSSAIPTCQYPQG